VKDAAKDAGDATVKTSKKVGHKVKKTTKHGVNKAAGATEDSAAKVKSKTKQ
jgi:hypothetical protein